MIGDASVQESVFRALRSLPPALVAGAVLDRIVELAARTDWSAAVVDVFGDELDEASLRALAAVVDGAPQEARGAYVRALEVAASDGSLHAATLLELLGRPASGRL